MEIPPVIESKGTAINAKPQSSIPGAGQLGNWPAAELRPIRHADRFKINAVKPDQSLLGSEPDIAVLGLRQGAHCVDRQTDLPRPGPAVVLIDTPARIEGKQTQ